MRVRITVTASFSYRKVESALGVAVAALMVWLSEKTYGRYMSVEGRKGYGRVRIACMTPG